MRAAFALSLMIAWMLGSTPRRAEAASGQRRLALLPSVVEGAGGSVPTDRVFEELARAADLRVGVDVVPYNELYVDGAEPIAAAASACGAEVPCISRVLYDAHIDLGLRVVVNFALVPSLVSLSLVDPRSQRIIEESVVEANGVAALGDALRTGVGAMLDKLGLVRGGRIEVVVSSPDIHTRVGACTSDACAEVDPRAPDARRPNRFTVLPGRYRAEAEREGEPAHQALVTVELGREVRVPIDVGEPKVAQVDESVLSKGWFWGVVGGAALLAGTAAVLIATNPFATPEPTRGCLCISTTGGSCPPCN